MQGRQAASSSKSGRTALIESWQDRLDELVAEVAAPGAVFGFQRGDDRRVFASGLANLDTEQPMRPETLFPVASLSKIYTATLAMQLVDEGRLDLDRPVREVLPDFRVADQTATERLTPRHLLTHSSGLDGDKFDSFGRGDDAMARYVADCATLGQVHDVGSTFSYCNSGVVILGRIIEVLRATTFEAALRDHLLEPLGATQTGMLPEDLIWRPLAAGHIDDESGALAVFRHWENDRAHGPAGGVVANVPELLDVAQLHLGDGIAPSGARLLSGKSVRSMREAQVRVPNPYEDTTHWGLGWELAVRPGQPTLVSHGGDLLAHHARFVTCPAADLVVCLLVNGDGADRIAKELFAPLLTDVGVTPYEPPQRPQTPAVVDPSPVVGTYRTPAVRVRVAADKGRTSAEFTIVAEEIAAMLPPNQRQSSRDLVPVEDGFYLMSPDDEAEPWQPVVFYESEGQHYMHASLRAIRRTS